MSIISEPAVGLLTPDPPATGLPSPRHRQPAAPPTPATGPGVPDGPGRPAGPGLPDGSGVLPQPPTDTERDAYLRGGQHRWALLLCLLGFAVITVSLARFALTHTVLYPFLALVAISALSAALGAVTSTRRRRLTLDQHQHTVRTWHPTTTHPSIDVFLPSAGEPLTVLRNTYYHVSRLHWPGPLHIHILDDSARPDLEVLALQYGFSYHVRPHPGHLKKAGNLKHGFDSSSADLILILDADFAPRPDTLTHLVPYLDDPTIGIVQSPQFFDAADPRMNWLQRGAGATQELFYRWVQPSRDRAGAPICVGTNALYRRTALTAAGGFAQIGHSEDVHTGVNLRRAGYRTRYIPVNLAKGLCPDTLPGFINQQYRWCAGSMSLLKDPTFHTTRMGLSAKLAFWSGFAYYLTTALFVLTMPLPTIIMLWAYPDAITPTNYLPLLPSFLAIWLALPHLMHAPWTPTVLRVQMIYSYAHALAIFDTARGHTAAWIPTGTHRTGTPVAVKVRWMMLIWITTTLTATTLGLARGLLHHPPTNYLPLLTLTLLTAYLKIPALLTLPPTKETQP